MSHFIARGVCFGVIVSSTAGLMSSALAQPCAHRWDVEFGASGASSIVWDLEEFDDGTGPALYVAGQFGEMQGQRAWAIAKWDGREWSEVGNGLSRDGERGFASALFVWDDGRGPALYVGGAFTHAGEVQASNVARWDGRAWEPLGAGTSDLVMSFGAFDDGRGEALFVGGEFHDAGGQPAALIARWDGADWEPCGDGLVGRHLGVLTITAFDDGQGPMLYAGGGFYDINGPKLESAPAYLLARWNGRYWSAVPGANLGSAGGQTPHIDQLLVHDDGGGKALYVVGAYSRVAQTDSLWRWDGREWTEPGGGIFHFGTTHPDALCVFDDGRGPALWIGGSEVTIKRLNRRSNFIRWDGESLSIPESRLGSGDWIYTFAEHNDGFGSALYAGGYIRFVQGPNGGEVRHITRLSRPHMALSHSPLRAGQRAAFATSCSTPGQRVNFLYSARGLGSVFIPQLGISIDLDRPHLIGHSIADPGGKAGLSRAIPPDASGRTLWLQAAEVGRKTEVVESVIE